jgi:hypothetical protein
MELYTLCKTYIVHNAWYMYVYVWRSLLVFQFIIIYLKFIIIKLANLYCSEGVVQIS